ncbi:MAG: aspartate/glutamate racemase family protein [Desulfofustis sp.]|nr:aspartate/glutamate racemase family protein [Desulfofustis sp.]
MIGVYDSGLGGLLLARKLGERYPERQIHVFCDTSGSTLSARPVAEVVEHCSRGLSILVEQGAELIVVACHEAGIGLLTPDKRHAAAAVPLIDLASVAAHAALAMSTGGRIGVITTRTVADRGIYQSLLLAARADLALFCQACPLLLPLIEEGWYNKVETKMIIKRCLRPLRERQIDTLIPACSSYQLVLPQIAARVGRRTRVVDPFAALIDTVAEQLPANQPPGPPDAPRYRIQVTRRHDAVNRVIQNIFGRSTGRCEVL